MTESPDPRWEPPLINHPISLLIYVNTDGTVQALGDVFHLKNAPMKEYIAYLFSRMINGLLDESPHHFSYPRHPTIGYPTVPLVEEDFMQGNAIAQQWMTASAEWGESMAIPVEEGWFLYGLTRAIRPRFTLEVGTHKGFSTVFLASAVRDNRLGTMVTLDIADHGQRGRLANRGLIQPLVECILIPESEYTPPYPIELFFHDGAHGKLAIQDSLSHFEPFFAQGAVLLIDDTRFEPTQQIAIDQWKEKTGSIGISLPVPTGLQVIRYGKSQFEGERDGFKNDMLDNLIG